MAKNTSRYRKTVRIVQGGKTYLGPRMSKSYPPTDDDQFYDVEPLDTLNRVAHRFFGSPYLWWIVADFNDIIDPFVELEVGQTLRLPSQARLWMEVLV